MSLKRIFPIMAFVAVLLGCGYNPRWEQQIPGRYEMRRGGIVESIVIDPNGLFLHEVEVEGRQSFTEIGEWRVSRGKYVLLLSPYTEFVDIGSVNNGLLKPLESRGRLSEYPFWPNFTGSFSFSEITPDINYRYCLKRIGVVGSNTITKPLLGGRVSE